VVALLFRQEINCRPLSSEFRSRLDLKAGIEQALDNDLGGVFGVDDLREVAAAE